MQVVRRHPIHASTMALNRAYWALPQIRGTVWEHYMLVASQWPTIPSPPSPQNDGGYFPGQPLTADAPRENYQSADSEGEPRQHHNRDLFPGCALKLHVLPPEPIQRARARLRRHAKAAFAEIVA